MRGARSTATEKTSETSFSEGSPSGDAGATDQIDRRGRANEVLACAKTSFGEGSPRRSRCEVKRPEPTPRNTADGPPQSFFNSLVDRPMPSVALCQRTLGALADAASRLSASSWKTSVELDVCRSFYLRNDMRIVNSLSRKRRAAPSFLAPLGGRAGRSPALGAFRGAAVGPHRIPGFAFRQNLEPMKSHPGHTGVRRWDGFFEAPTC